MARLTNLQMVRDILNDLDSDDVTTVLETEESRQVLQILETTYYGIIDGRVNGWPHLFKPFQLTASSAATPTHMSMANTVMDISYIKYNVRNASDTKDKFLEIDYMAPQEFMRTLDGRDSAATEITQVTDASGIAINVYNERAPKLWTTFDDEVIVFDAYDAVVDTVNMTAAKTQCYGQIYPSVTMTDGAYFDLPIDAFSYLLAEAKSVCFINLKQLPNQKIEQQSTSQRRKMSQEAHKVKKGIDYPNYGRAGKK